MDIGATSRLAHSHVAPKTGAKMLTKQRIIGAARFTCAGVLIAAATSVPAATWRIDESTAALSGARSVTASLGSVEPLQNMIGAPEPATLILRCAERNVSAFVSWPQVLSLDATKEFSDTPQTMVLWRTDEAPIKGNFWDRSTNGSAAGKFSTGGAMKIIGPITSARKLVVRMTGTTTQDAVFELGDVAPVIARVEQACGVSPRSGR